MSLQPGSVVALVGHPGDRWVAAMERVWADGGAIAPIDPRLPAPEADTVLAAMAPTHVMDVASHEITVRRGGREAQPGDALVMATSGTTGQPKAVIHTHDSIAASAEATNRWLGVTADDRWMACLPLAHIGGLSVVFRARAAGAGLTVLPRFDPRAVMASVDGPSPVTRISLVTKALAAVDPSRFTTILLGGAAPPRDRPANVIATYGMTETGSGVVYNGAVLDGVELRVDSEDQIWVRGAMLMRAYRNAPDPFDADGWFPTGDLGRWDGTTLSVFGRAGDVIVTGGEKVYPARVEAVLAAHPQIAGAAVVGRADPQWGHQVVAVIEPTPGATPPSLDELRDAVKRQLPVWYAPADVVVAPLPRTSLGKVRRDGLKKLV